MWNRFVLTIAMCAALAECGPPASAGAIVAQVFPLTGEIRFTNRGLGPVPIALYSISSPSGALNSSAGVWTSIEDNYDLSGNRLVDAVNEWQKLTAPGSTTDLSEGEIKNTGGSLPAMRSISLGTVWNAHKVPFPDLLFEINEPNGTEVGITVEYKLDGDYSGNGTVDLTDYQLFWRSTFGSSTFLLADGDLNGSVDTADYVLWRKNLGRSVTSVPFAAGASTAAASLTAVPEPSPAVTLMLALAIISRARAPLAARGATRRRAARP
jgi:hypothetical protein